jgi:hypothetical protein
VDKVIGEIELLLDRAVKIRNIHQSALMDDITRVSKKMLRSLPKTSVSLEQLAAYEDVMARVNAFLGPMPTNTAGDEANHVEIDVPAGTESLGTSAH